MAQSRSIRIFLVWALFVQTSLRAADLYELDFYARLGVSRDASTSQIREAYVALRRKNQVALDKGDAEVTRRMQAVGEAWNTLKSEKLRGDYDRGLGNPKSQAGADFTVRPGGQARPAGPDFTSRAPAPNHGTRLSSDERTAYEMMRSVYGIELVFTGDKFLATKSGLDRYRHLSNAAREAFYLDNRQDVLAEKNLSRRAEMLVEALDSPSMRDLILGDLQPLVSNGEEVGTVAYYLPPKDSTAYLMKHKDLLQDPKEIAAPVFDLIGETSVDLRAFLKDLAQAKGWPISPEAFLAQTLPIFSSLYRSFGSWKLAERKMNQLLALLIANPTPAAYELVESIATLKDAEGKHHPWDDQALAALSEMKQRNPELAEHIRQRELKREADRKKAERDQKFSDFREACRDQFGRIFRIGGKSGGASASEAVKAISEN